VLSVPIGPCRAVPIGPGVDPLIETLKNRDSCGWLSANSTGTSPLIGEYGCPSGGGCTGGINSGTFGYYTFAMGHGNYNGLTTGLESGSGSQVSKRIAVFVTTVPLNHQS